MGFYRVKHLDGSFVARINASSPNNLLETIFCPPRPLPDRMFLGKCERRLWDAYVYNYDRSDPNIRNKDFIVEDELRLLDSEVDRQIFGHELQIDMRGNPARTTDHTLVPFYSTNEADAERVWKQAFSNLCAGQNSMSDLCKQGPEILTNKDNFVIGLYEFGKTIAPTKAHALCLAVLKTITDISQFSL